MKKNLLYLFVLICSVSLFTGCSDDDDEVTYPIDTDIAGVYKGTFDITVSGEPLGSGIPKNITISKAGNASINMELKDFSFLGMDLGTITLNDCVLAKDGDNYKFIGKQALNVEKYNLTGDIDAQGTISGNTVNVNLDIAAKLAGLQQAVKVIYKGARLSGSESSEAKITSFTFDSEIVTEQPVIDEENGIITFKVNDAATIEQLKLSPIIEVSEKATVTPASGIKQDFSNNQGVEYVVIAEDGTTKKYTVSIDGRIVEYSFEDWTFEKVSSDESSPINYWDLSTGGWCTSNGALYMLKGFLQAVSIDAPYAVTPLENGYKGKAAEVRSTDSKGMWMITVVPKVTAGTLFLGTFETDLENTLKSTKFGIMYSKEPVALKGYYKYKAGSTYYKTVVNPDDEKDVKGEEVPNKKDKGLISIVLYEVKDDTESLDGTNIYDESLITAIAKKECEDIDEFTPFELTLEYKKAYDANKKYKLAIICSSSAEGDKFEGAPESVLTVDEFSLITK